MGLLHRRKHFVPSYMQLPQEPANECYFSRPSEPICRDPKGSSFLMASFYSPHIGCNFPDHLSQVCTPWVWGLGENSCDGEDLSASFRTGTCSFTWGTEFYSYRLVKFTTPVGDMFGLPHIHRPNLYLCWLRTGYRGVDRRLFNGPVPTAAAVSVEWYEEDYVRWKCMDCDGNSRGLFQGTMSEFGCRD
jgi:hypothetical protein